jgi:hypothetical protein
MWRLLINWVEVEVVVNFHPNLDNRIVVDDEFSSVLGSGFSRNSSLRRRTTNADVVHLDHFWLRSLSKQSPRDTAVVAVAVDFGANIAGSSWKFLANTYWISVAV